MSINVVVVGACGKRLGYPVCQAISASGGDLNLAVAVESPQFESAAKHPMMFNGALFTTSFSEAMTTLFQVPSNKQDRLVVFYATKADALLARLQEAAECFFTTHVIGTTGLDQETIQAIQEMAEQGHTIVLAPNFSAEATLVTSFAAQAARALPTHDVEVVELHHRLKKDAPSGTALKIGEAVALARGQNPDESAQFGWPRTITERSRETVNVVGLRGGGVPGEHTVYFLGEHALLALTQRALSSASYVEGALRAIRWAAGQEKSGLYDMFDVFGLQRP